MHACTAPHARARRHPVAPRGQGYQHLRRRSLRHLVRHVSPGERAALGWSCGRTLHRQGLHAAALRARAHTRSHPPTAAHTHALALLRRAHTHARAHDPAVLDKLGVCYWADFGTLLGMYREVRAVRGASACDARGERACMQGAKVMQAQSWVDPPPNTHPPTHTLMGWAPHMTCTDTSHNHAHSHSRNHTITPPHDHTSTQSRNRATMQPGAEGHHPPRQRRRPRAAQPRLGRAAAAAQGRAAWCARGGGGG
jgi:hypothetical protein